jgi:hypothetical protein
MEKSAVIKSNTDGGNRVSVHVTENLRRPAGTPTGAKKVMNDEPARSYVDRALPSTCTRKDGLVVSENMRLLTAPAGKLLKRMVTGTLSVVRLEIVVTFTEVTEGGRKYWTLILYTRGVDKPFNVTVTGVSTSSKAEGKDTVKLTDVVVARS